MSDGHVPEIVKNAARADMCVYSFYYFFKQFWPEFSPSEYSDNWHIEYLCNELQECYNRFNRGEKAINILINVPPGTSKSSIVTIAFPVWLWVQDATLKVISGSYSERIALTHSVKSRDVIKSDKFRAYFPHIEIKRDVDGKSMFENTLMGARFTTSVGGSLTGQHGHMIILDDPLSSEGAASEVIRATANKFISETLSTRKIDKETVPIIVVMQRLHTEDCSGFMLARDPEMIHICLPGELSVSVKPAHLKDKYINGLLDVGRLNRNVLERLKIDLGSYAFAGQIQQTPAPLTDSIWKRDWFVLVDDDNMPTNMPLSTDFDLAYTEKQTNSASAFVTTGKVGNKLYIDKIGWKHCEFPALIEWMRIQAAPFYIEGKASGKSAKQTLLSLGIPSVEVQVDGGDKIARASLATPYAESGMVYLRRSIADKLFSDPSQGILFFPLGAHDDLQDAMVQAITRQLKSKTFWVN